MNDDQGAAGALVGAVVAALKGVPGLSQVADGAPLQAGDAGAVVEAGPETDWGHNSGQGAEVRLAVLVRCAGERPERARVLLARVRAALDGLGPQVGPGWYLVTLAMLRSRVVRSGAGVWVASVEYRGRVLRG